MTPPPVRAAVSAAPGPARTTRADRIRDAIAIGLVVVGAAMVLVAHNVNTRLATQPIVTPKGHTAFSVWLRYYYVDLAGWAAILAGVLVGIASYVVHARRIRRDRGRAGGAA